MNGLMLTEDLKLRTMARVSFDYDGTFGSNHKIRCFAKILIKNNHEVWIVTARYEDLSKYDPNLKATHNALFRQAKWCGITKEHIKFCNMQPKAMFFENKDFLWHLDDDPEELDQINVDTPTIGVSCITGNWLHTCRDLIKNTEKNDLQKLPF